MKIIKGLATFFSMAFQPVLMPLFAISIILLSNNALIMQMGEELRWEILYYCSIFTIVVPMVIFISFYQMGWVSDVNLTQRKERVIPTFLVMISFYVFYFVIRNMEEVTPEFKYAVFGAVTGPLIANFITMTWKISIHSLGVASAFGAVYGLSKVFHTNQMQVLIILFSLIVIVGGSRLILNRHTPMQVLAGATLGFVATAGSILYGLML